jgi:transcriptional regulator with XRE-family HTH domain
MESEHALSRLIGQRIAQRRGQLRLSLDEMATQSRVSRAMISRIERGEVHASAVVLDKLCAGLGISLSALFAPEAALPLLRHADQPIWQDPASFYLRREVTPTGTGSPVRIAEIDFPVGAEVTFAAGRDRAIDQHVWVLAGEIEISTAGTTYNLAAGDCLHMRLTDGNRFRNVSGRPARYAVILATGVIA